MGGTLAVWTCALLFNFGANPLKTRFLPGDYARYSAAKNIGPGR
jgi:hypothetical protein